MERSACVLTVVTATKEARARGRIAFLERCVRSVAELGTPHEHLVCDGASHDGTPETLRRLAGELDSLKVASSPDGGLYEALNKAVAVARGEWLLVLGDDDFIVRADILDRLLAEVTETSVDFVTAAVRWGDAEIRTGRPHMILSGMSCPHAGVLIRTRLVRAYGGFDTRYRISGDYDLCLRLILSGLSVRVVSTPFAQFTDRGGLSTTDFTRLADEDAWVKIRNLKINPRHHRFISAYGCLPLMTSLRYLLHRSRFVRRAAFRQAAKWFKVRLFSPGSAKIAAHGCGNLV